MTIGSVITSRENPKVKTLRSLAADPREQRRQGRTVLDGPHLVDCYRQRVGLPELLAVSETGSFDEEVQRILAKMPAVPTLHLRDSLFREVSGVASPVGILAVIAIPASPSEVVRGSSVLLDAVQDAGNVGTILRTAAAAGVHQVFLGPGCAGAWTPRVLRAAQGAHFGLRIHEQADLVAVLGQCSGNSLAAVARGGKSLYEHDLTADLAWVFGSEGTGVSAPLLSAARGQVTIPMAPDNESLNVAAAAAVCLFEERRQRMLTDAFADEAGRI